MPDYQKVWNVMNDLEMTTSKICSAREILDAAVDRIQESQYEKAEVMVSAAYEYLEYYLKEFDEKFKDAWKETVVKLHEEGPSNQTKEEITEDNLEKLIDRAQKFYDRANHKILSYSEAIESGYNMTADGFWIPPEKENDLYDQNRNKYKEDKVVKWQLPVQQSMIDGVTDYYVNFPDDLLEATNLREGDKVEWVDRGDGSYLLRKIVSDHDVDLDFPQKMC